MTGDARPKKQCSKCKEEKPIQMFGKDKYHEDGLNRICKGCRAKDYIANADVICEKKRVRYHSSIEEHREAQRAYRAENIERLREWRRAYYERNSVAIRANRAKRWEYMREHCCQYNHAYHLNHRESICARLRAYSATHREEDRARGHKRRAQLKGNGGSFTAKEIKDMRIAQAGICAYCGDQHDPDKLTIDHIIPISQGGSNDISNICLACMTCNLSKKSHT